LWLSVDPLAEKGPEYSPYCYTFNNPTNLTDPDGNWPYPPIYYIIAYYKTKNWIQKNVSFNDHSYSTGKSEKVRGSGIYIEGTPFSGNSGRSVAGHPEDNVVVPYEVIDQLGGWRDIPGTEPINGMTDAVKKVENTVTNFKTDVEIFDEGMDAGEKVVNLIEKTGVLDTKLPQSKFFDKDGKMHGMSFYYYDKTNQTYYGSDTMTQDEINKIIQRKDVIINPKQQGEHPTY